MTFNWREALTELLKESRRFRAKVEGERHGKTIPKLGHLVSREEYTHLTELLRELLPNPQIRDAVFRSHRSDMVFITFVHLCGLIQWDYEHSFWVAYNAVFGGSGETPQHNFIREAVIAPACRDLGLPLVRSDYGWMIKTMYVTSLIGAAGIPPRRVGKVRDFVAWFYREHGHLVSAGLSPEEFNRLLAGYEALSREEQDDLRSILYDAACKTVQLVDELKARGYEADDLAMPEVVTEMERVLGFRPSDIFGFRGHEAFMSLVGELTQQITLAELGPLVRRLQARLGNVKLISPRGDKALTLADTERLGQVAYGRYYLEYRGGHRELHVVPRASFSIYHMDWLLSNRAWVFYTWDNGLLAVWGPEPFEVKDSRRGEEPAHLVCAAGREGYLWAGTQAVGATLICESGGVERARLEPREGVILNPRLRLRPDRQGLELVIPSMVLHQPEFAGRTVLLEVNGRPVTDGRLVVNRNGHLQFSQNRRYALRGDEKDLQVAVRLEQGSTFIYQHRPISLSDPVMLFRSNDRERVLPGDRRFVPEQLVLVSRAERPKWQLPDGATISNRAKFGPWNLFHIELPGGNGAPIDLQAEELSWSFAAVAALSLDIRPGAVPDGPWQGRDGVLLHGQTADLVLTPGRVVDEAAEDLALTIVTGRDRNCRASLTELQRLGLVRKGAGGEWLIDFRSLQKRYLAAEPYGEYRIVLQDADFFELSDGQVAVVPLLTLRSEPVYYEETESWLAVDCDRPELTTDGVNDASVSTRIRFVPKLLPAADGTLVPQPVRAEVALKYPETTLAFQVTPVIVGMRVATRGALLPAGELNHDQLTDGELIIIGPAGHEANLACGQAAWGLDVPDNGALKFPLDQVVKSLTDQRTMLSVRLGDWRRELTIHWPLTLRLETEQVSVNWNAESLHVGARPSVAGPYAARIEVSLNGLFDQLAHGTWSVAELAAGEAVLEVLRTEIEAEDSVYLEMRADGQKLAEVELLLKAKDDASRLEAGRTPDQMSDDQLLRAAVKSQKSGDTAGLSRLAEEVNRRAAQEVAAPLAPERSEPVEHGPLFFLRRLEAMRRIDLETRAWRQRMASVEALQHLAEAWEAAEISEEVAEAYVTELRDIDLGPLPATLQKRLLDLPVAWFRHALVKAGAGRCEDMAIDLILDMLDGGDCTTAEAAEWLRPIVAWSMARLAALGLDRPAVRRLLSELTPAGKTPPFIQAGATVTLDARQGKVTAIEVGGQMVLHAPFPAAGVKVRLSVKSQSMTLFTEGPDVWLQYQNGDKFMTCLYPNCGFASSDPRVFYPHLDTHKGVNWTKTFQARGTPKLRVRHLDWVNQPEPPRHRH